MLAQRADHERRIESMAETHHERTTIPPREGEGASGRPESEGEGDAQIDDSPPNVDETQPLDESAISEPDDDAEGGRSASGSATAESEAERLRSELDMAADRLMRVAAEFDNYRKRSERERSEQQARIRGEVVGRFVDVIDDIDRVAGYDDNASAAALLEGVRLVEKKFRQILAGLGVEPIDPVGEPFDPETMEALMTVPTERRDEDDMVADVFQKGYRISGALVRPARVRVRKYE
jgi:molecular chaperone GrpE